MLRKALLSAQPSFSSMPQVVTVTSVPFTDRRCSTTRQPFKTFPNLSGLFHQKLGRDHRVPESSKVARFDPKHLG